MIAQEKAVTEHQMISVREAAKIAGISHETAYNLIDTGVWTFVVRYPGVRRTVVSKQGLYCWLEEQMAQSRVP